MRVLHINSYYNGAPLYSNLYKSQAAKGTEIDVYVPLQIGSVARSKMIPSTICSYDYSKIDRYTFFLKELKSAKRIEKKLNIQSYTILHAHSLFANGYIAYKLHKKYGIPYIIAVRNTDVNFFFKKVIPLRSLGNRIMHSAAKVVFISPAYLDEVRKHYVSPKWEKEFQKKAIVIPNGIDNFWLNNTHRHSELRKNEITLLAVGDIDGNKNNAMTLKAQQLLQSKGYHIEYKIVGRVKDEKLLHELIEGGAQYLGTMHKEELLQVYRKSDILVVPSHHETFGLVYAEAMSQGLPVIYTKEQGFDGHFPDGTVGYAVSDSSPTELAEKIEAVLQNYAELSQNCLTLVERFQWDQIAEQYCEIYEAATKDTLG